MFLEIKQKIKKRFLFSLRCGCGHIAILTPKHTIIYIPTYCNWGRIPGSPGVIGVIGVAGPIIWWIFSDRSVIGTIGDIRLCYLKKNGKGFNECRASKHFFFFLWTNKQNDSYRCLWLDHTLWCCVTRLIAVYWFYWRLH